MSPVAVVTGAGRGMGAATVDLLVAAGWQVVAVDSVADDPALDYALSTKTDLEEVAIRHGSNVRTVVGDVRSASDMRAAVEAAVTHFGGLQAAVAAAGVISGGTAAWEISDAQWDVQFGVNVNGVRHLASAAVPALLAAAKPRQGRFVAVSSTAGVLGLPRSAPTARPSMRSSGTPARWRPTWPAAVSPPTWCAPARPAGRCSMHQRRSTTCPRPTSSRSHHLLQRLLEPAEPAALIAWLCGLASSGLTGAVLPVDGGMTAS